MEHIAEILMHRIARGTEDTTPGEVELNEKPDDEQTDDREPDALHEWNWGRGYRPR